MLINRDHIPWIFIVIAATAVAFAFYATALHPAWLPFPFDLPIWLQPDSKNHAGGTPLGLIFGGFSLGVFIFAALLGARKKVRLWKIGHVQIWLRAHIWLTILTIPLVAFHCDFHSGGPMTTALLVLYAIVMLSGFYGLFLQHVIPKMMKEMLPAETVYEQIPYVRSLLVAEAEKIRESLLAKPAAPKKAAAAPAEQSTATPVEIPVIAEPAALTSDEIAAHYFADFFDSDILPYLRSRNGKRLKLGRQSVSDDVFRLLKIRLSPTQAAVATQAQDWCDERRRMDLQSRLHHWLHGWLLVHVPTSFLLLLMTIWHAWITVFYY